ncbi:hypothetical protein BH11BAC3_BH11BAC3_47080 [soil metagenome]
MAKNTKPIPTLTVKHIGSPSFNLIQNNFTKENGNVKFSVLNNLRFSVDNNIINLTLLVSYNHPDTDPFLMMEIENMFELTDLNKFVPPNQDIIPTDMDIPENILITIASVSFSHARAIMGQHIAGTFAQGIYLPIIDGRDFAKNIFGATKIK